MAANAIGSIIALNQPDYTIKVYSVVENTFKYVGSVPVHQQTEHCAVTNGLPGSPGILLAFTPSFVKVVEISRMMTPVSTVRVSNEPILHVYSTAIDGDYLLITSHRARYFSIRDVLIGKFEFPVVKFSGPLVLTSSTRLRCGKVHNMVVCGTKLFEIVKQEGGIDTELLCKLPASSKPCDMKHFFCIPGSGLWLVRWFGKGTRGQFMMSEDKEIVELEPEYELDFDANDFVVDTCSNSLIGFGLQPNLDFLSDCVALTALIEPIEAAMICDVLYDSDCELLFAVFPNETIFFNFTLSTTSVRFKQVNSFSGKVLRVTSARGVCLCIFETERVYIAQYSFVVLARVPFDAIVTAATVLNGTAVICLIDGTVSRISVDKPEEVPVTLFAVQDSFSVFRFANSGEVLYSEGNRLFSFDLETNTQRLVQSCAKPIHDFITHKGRVYIGFRDGSIGMCDPVHLAISSTTGPPFELQSSSDVGWVVPQVEREIRVGQSPIEFCTAGENLVIQGDGIWVLKDQRPVPIMQKNDRRNESLAQFNVAGACSVPFLDFTLVVAYNNQIHVLATEDMGSLTSKPQVYSFGLKTPAFSIKENARFRAWVICSENGLVFYDTKHRTVLKSESDISGCETITAIEFWDIEMDGKIYTHLAIGSKRPTAEGTDQYWLRSCSIKRDRNFISIKKRLKVQLTHQIKSLTSYNGTLLVVSREQLQSVQLRKECGLVLNEPKLILEGLINDFSVMDGYGYASSSRGVFKVNLESYETVNDAGHMVNRMRDCLCHIVVPIDGTQLVLVGQKDCFLQVLELMGRTWRIVQRIDTPERILRMHRLSGKMISSNEAIIVALTTNGSFVELKISGKGSEVGPYLF